MNKHFICVYTICKNESKNITKFINSIKEADLIYILDTGSTDDTYCKLKSNSHNINIYSDSINYNPDTFDFSVARNEALNRAKKIITNSNQDIDDYIYLSLDLDEFLEAKGIDKLRNIICNNDNFDVISLTGISPTDNTEMIINSKCHTSNFYWHRSIHEIIKRDDKKESEWITIKSDIKYYHYQDRTKIRDYYGKLKLAYEKDPHDIKTLMYLCWESALHNEFEQMFYYSNLCKYELENNEEDDHYMDIQYLIQVGIYQSIYYRKLKIYDLEVEILEDIFMDYIISEEYQPLRIIPYLLASAYWNNNEKDKSITEYKRALNTPLLRGTWIEDMTITDDVIADKLATALYYNEEYYESIYYSIMATKLKPDNTHYKGNFEAIKNGFEMFIRKT